MIMDDVLNTSQPKIDKTQAFKFKAAIVNQFNCETFEEFVDALREKINYAFRVPGHVTVYGHDAYDRWFRLHIDSYRYQPLSNCISLTVNYKWEKSSDKSSNWNKEDITMSSGMYKNYKHYADLIYKKSKPIDDVKPVDSSFEQWKKKNPLAYEIIFTLISYYGKKNGRDAKSEMYFIKQNFKDRIIGMDIGTDCAGIHCPKVNHFKIKDICTLSEFVRIELDDMTYTDSIGVTRKIDCTYTASIIKVEYSIIQKISSDVDASYNEKCKTGKPHDDAAVDAFSYTVSSGRRTGKYLTSAIEAAIHIKLVEENDISVGDFEGIIDAFTFENYGATFRAYVKSIGYVTAEDHPGSTEKKIELHDLIVCIDEDQGARTDIRIDSVPYYGIHFDIRRGGITDAITGVHVSKHSNEWVIYRIRRQERLGKAVDLHYLPPVTPVSYSSADVESCIDYYNHLNKKETKEMKKDENKIIINHNAVIVYIGKQKAVVRVIDKKTKEETGSWNTKAGVIMAIAKVFGIGTHMYKMYEVLNTINKPTNKTLDFVADEIRLNGKRIKNYKWYHEAINTKRPEPGKQVEIIME